jgi:cytochrome b involved in lipid metabolism
MILLGQVSIVTGVITYNSSNSPRSPLGIIEIVIFFALLIIMEVIYQVYQRKRPQPFKIPEKTMTVEEFNKNVAEKGKMLVILDDLVIDVADYMENHPGGRFLLAHNIGRDVSKFFYGGYSLDGNLINKPKRHTHSNMARQ